MILDGVRRTKARQILGYNSIEARVEDSESGHIEPARELPIEMLRSPKEHIDLRGYRRWDRWQRVINAVANDEELEPIEVTLGNGVPIDEVGFVY